MKTKASYILIALLFLFFVLVIATSLTFRTKGKTFSVTPSPIPIFTPTSIPTFTPTPSPTIRPTPKPKPVFVVSNNLDSLFAKYGAQYGVDPGLLKKIAQCESGLDTNQTANGYAGLFQFADFAWKEARGRLGADPNLDLRFNPEESIRTAAHEIQYKGTSGWSDCNH